MTKNERLEEMTRLVITAFQGFCKKHGTKGEIGWEFPCPKNPGVETHRITVPYDLADLFDFHCIGQGCDALAIWASLVRTVSGDRGLDGYYNWLTTNFLTPSNQRRLEAVGKEIEEEGNQIAQNSFRELADGEISETKLKAILKKVIVLPIVLGSPMLTRFLGLLQRMLIHLNGGRPEIVEALWKEFQKEYNL